MVPVRELSVVSAVLGFMVVLAWRIREGRSAVTLRKIVIPPLGMATGFSMFLVPAFRVPWAWAAGAFVLGALVLAYPLVRTSRLALQGDTVMSVQQTAGLFFVLAFGMILRWRLSMLFEYRRLTCS